MTVESHRLAADSGDGSRSEIDDMYDAEEYETKDQRADTRTTFYAKDIDNLDVSKRRKKQLHRSLRRQEGEDYGEGTAASNGRRQRKQQNREEWKRRIVSTYAGQLGLTKAQKERAKHIFLDVLNINTFGPHSSENVALGVINVVVNEDGWQIEDDSQFHELMIECGLTSNDDESVPSMRKMRQLRQLVRERVPSMN